MRFVQTCRSCGEWFPWDVDADCCAVCAAANAGDTATLARMSHNGSEHAAAVLYDDFGLNRDDVAALLAHAVRLAAPFGVRS